MSSTAWDRDLFNALAAEGHGLDSAMEAGWRAGAGVAVLVMDPGMDANAGVVTETGARCCCGCCCGGGDGWKGGGLLSAPLSSRLRL